MPKLLFIGSAAADVILRLPALPAPGDDIHIQSQQVSLGGCACNAFRIAALAGTSECSLFAPVGSGIWGEWVRKALADRGVVSLVPPVDDPNGCCYCLVSPDGERSFLCEHGAEYRFSPDWFDALPDDWDGVYICGLEIEEPTGEAILSWLEKHPPRRLYFAPGPRIGHIHPQRMARIMALQPVFHLNEPEALSFTRSDRIELAAALIGSLTDNDVIITLGAQGAFLRSGSHEEHIPAFPARVADAIGAGDAHIGAVMAAEAEGLSLPEAVRRANRISAAVVSQPGAELSPEKYRHALEESPLAYPTSANT